MLLYSMKHYSWDNEKNILLKETRGICFEHIVMRAEKGDLLDIIKNRIKQRKTKKKVDRK